MTSGRRARLEADLTDEELARMPRCTKLLYLVMSLCSFLTPLPFVYLLILTPSSKAGYVRRFLGTSFAGGALRGTHREACFFFRLCASLFGCWVVVGAKAKCALLTPAPALLLLNPVHYNQSQVWSSRS